MGGGTVPKGLPMLRRLLAACLLVCVPASSAVAEDLPQLSLDPAATTVSGLSSGAFMAVQMHVAFSERIAGAGVVAGGPYFCSRGEVVTALNTCMSAGLDGPDAAALWRVAERFAAEEAIDDLRGLAGDRVYLFSGTEDETVTRPVTDATRDFYREAGIAPGDIRYVTDVPAGHAFLAPGGPVPCGETDPPFITDCGIDQAGDILAFLYGTLNDPVAADPARLAPFDQVAFLPEAERHGMDQRGFVYVPERCAAGATCRLHIAFHGCEQTRDQIGDLFARTAGFNRWAEANEIVVLYPQAQEIPSPLFDPFGGNPKGCWDWFAYDDEDFALRKGRQMAAVARMAARLGASLTDAVEQGGETTGDAAFCRRHADFNGQHLMHGRAFFCAFGIVCATGSGEFIGPVFVVRTLYESPQGRFSTDPCQ